MNIGIVLSKPPGYSETFFASKIKGLQSKGYSVTLYTQSKSESFNLCAVKTAAPIFKTNIIKQLIWFFIVFLKLLWHQKSVCKFIQLEKKEGSSRKNIIKKLYLNAHLLTQNLDWLHFGFATMALGKENVAASINSKMAVSLRGFDIAIYPIKNPNCYNLLWKKVDKIHTISTYLYNLALKNGLSSSVCFQKITPAIDTSLFRPINTDFTKGTHLNIITIARLHWVKGLTDLLMALKELKAKGIPFSYKIVGDGLEFEKLKFLIHDLKLNDEVHLVGNKSPNEVKNLMATHEIYIQYSFSEGFCNAVLEAQAMGLLCIVSDAGALSENVLHGKSGWVVPKRNPQKLMETIATVSQMTSEEKRSIKEFAMKRVRGQFNLEKQQQEFMKFYAE